MTAFLLVVALLLASAACHYGLSRAGRRLPHWIARRRGLPPAARPPGARAFALATLAAQLALWLGAAWLISERIPALERLRGRTGAWLAIALDRPLFHIGEQPYTAIDVMTLPLLLLGVWLGASAVVWLLRTRVLAPLGVAPGSQATTSVLARYALGLLAGIIVLQAWGVDVRALAIVASVLGVGIGFGLQHIANDFVSGLIINLGRPMRPGDFVQVGNLSGVVERIGARSTEIRTMDRVAIFLPNSRFLESEVVNWSHGDPTSRIHVPVGVAYGSDVTRVRRALLEAARSHPDTLREPRPQVQLRRFGDSSLDFELLVWTRDPRNQQRLTSELNFRIAESLRLHGVQIPFPQRDLHLRSPSLDVLLHSLQDRLGAVLPAAPAPTLASRDGVVPDLGIDRDSGPEEWDDATLHAVLGRMRGAGGVATRTRRHRLKIYPGCFVGREAVDWLVAELGLSRAEAVVVGERLLQRGEIHHVLHEHGFRDGTFFYRFRDPVPADASVPA